MNHLRSQDFIPYYPHPAVYSDPAYYRTYGDPYLMQRLPPPAFLPPTSPPPSSSSRAYRNMYSSSGIDRYVINYIDIINEVVVVVDAGTKIKSNSTSTSFITIHRFDYFTTAHLII